VIVGAIDGPTYARSGRAVLGRPHGAGYRRGEFDFVSELKDEHFVVRGEGGRRAGRGGASGGAPFVERGAGEQSPSAHFGG
jgi:hypothetical protein